MQKRYLVDAVLTILNSSAAIISIYFLYQPTAFTSYTIPFRAYLLVLNILEILALCLIQFVIFCGQPVPYQEKLVHIFGLLTISICNAVASCIFLNVTSFVICVHICLRMFSSLTVISMYY